MLAQIYIATWLIDMSKANYILLICSTWCVSIINAGGVTREHQQPQRWQTSYNALRGSPVVNGFKVMFVAQRLTHWILRDVEVYFSNSFYELISWTLPVKLVLRESHRTSLAAGQYYDDVIKWKHFPRYWPLLQGIHWWLVNSPHKGQWRGALVFFFDLRLNKRLG